MNLDGLKSSSSGNFGPMGPATSNSGPSSCSMMKQGMHMGMDGPHPDGPGNGPFGAVSNPNVPINPNDGPPGPPKQAFDPISSMVQMSQQLTGGNGTPPNPSGSR